LFLLLLLLSFLLVAPKAEAKKWETGFLDRTLVLGSTTYKYQVYIPQDWSPQEKWPIILFLHGGGESADDGLIQTQVGIGAAIREHRSRIPAIVVLPQCPKDRGWVQSETDDAAMAALEAATAEFHADADRTYLTGISMGGYETWHLAAKFPGRFAA